MFTLVLVLYLTGPHPVLTTLMHDFETEETCTTAAEIVRALVRTQLSSGATVVWRCIERQQTAIG